MKKLVKNKNTIIAILCLTIIVLSIGFTLIALKLKERESKNKIYDVSIVRIQEGTAIKGGEILPTGTSKIENNGKTADFEFKLNNPKDTLTYIITVTNNGNIPAKLMSVPDVTTINGEEPTEVQFNVSVLDEKMVLQPTETAQIAVVAAWPNTSEEIPEGEVSKTATITLNYQQVTADDVGD